MKRTSQDRSPEEDLGRAIDALRHERRPRGRMVWAAATGIALGLALPAAVLLWRGAIRPGNWIRHRSPRLS